MAGAFEPSLAALQARQSLKWQRYGPDVLPLWVADMDFTPPTCIKDALIARAESGNLGYPAGYARGAEDGVIAAFRRWVGSSHNWDIEPSAILPLNGIIPGMYLAVRATSKVGESVVVQTPIYPPFMAAVENSERNILDNELVWSEDNKRWEMDLAKLKRSLNKNTRLLTLCNPHNPTGRVFSRAELEALAEIVLERDLYVLSDELHSDLVYPGAQHIPFASLSPEIAARTITLMGPTKTFTIAGLKIGFLVCENPQLLEKLKEVGRGIITTPNVMGQVAAAAAYQEGGPWLAEALVKLRENRDLVSDFMFQHLPGAHYATPEGTYLAFLDLRTLALGDELTSFLERAGLGLNPGSSFGKHTADFARLNFATSRSILEEALKRLEHLLHSV